LDIILNTINRRFAFRGFGVNSWSSLFVGYFLGASKISVNVSRLLLASKIDPFEELINYVDGGHLGCFLFHLPLLGLVSAQSLPSRVLTSWKFNLLSDRLKYKSEIANIVYFAHQIWHTHPLAPNLFFQGDIIVVHAFVSSCISLEHCNHLLQSLCMVLLHILWIH
jgi:hypothetical protein